VDLKERGKGYCPYMIATVAKHRRDKYNQDAFIRVEKDNLAALSQEDFADEKHQTRMD
jgi:hypothetical protein